MAPPRTFSYDLLKQLLRGHPDWLASQYADVLTEDVRKADPHAPRIKPTAVRRVISEYRDEWKESGLQVPARGMLHADLMPPLGSIAPNQRMATPLRHLRELSKERRGEAPVTDNEAIVRQQAIRWEARLRDNLEIADITDRGVVEIRPARADELDGDGKLIELAAWVLPGWVPAVRRNARGRGLQI